MATQVRALARRRRRRQKRLGLAHLKDSGRRTPRGAVVWRAADGPKPDATYLSPAEAQDELRKQAPAHRGRALAPHDPEDPRAALLDPQASQAQGLD
jgi:hypothetical protein